MKPIRDFSDRMGRSVGRPVLTRAARWLVAGLLLGACGTSVSQPPAGDVTALVGGRIQAEPDAPVIVDGTVLIEGGRISAIGKRAEVSFPAGARVIDCEGATITAGFWNSHVHFTGAAFGNADSAPADRVSAGLRSMLTSRGVVHAVDTGSWLPNTLALRRRVDSGEIPGPAILTAGSGFAPVGGSPYYILPAHLPELGDPATTALLIDGELDRGADIVKLFTGSWARPDSIVVMPVELVRAASEAAHRRGKLVFAHPSNSAGARVAIEGGVDVLAHTFPSELDGHPWDQTLPRMMHERGMSLIPTLKLFPYELGKLGLPPAVADAVLARALAQLRAFADLGGQVLFGTDVGYMTDFDPTDEYVYMQKAGLSYAGILAALTTGPAARLGASGRSGRLAVGLEADITVLDGDPAQDIRALGRVRATLRAGRVIYSAR